MTRRRSIVGAALLCGLCLFAFGASNASATSTYACEEVAAGTGGFTDSHCTKKGIGNFSTVKITKPVAIRGTNTTTITIKLVISGIKIHITCQLGTGTANASNEVVEGTNQGIAKEINAKFSECAVIEPASQNCKIKGGAFEIGSAQSTTFMISEEVTGVKITPTTGTTLTEVTMEGCKTAGLNGTFPLKGGLVGVVNSESPSLLDFTEASSKEGGLTLGGVQVIIIFTTHYVINGTDKTVSVEAP